MWLNRCVLFICFREVVNCNWILDNFHFMFNLKQLDLNLICFVTTIGKQSAVGRKHMAWVLPNSGMLLFRQRLNRSGWHCCWPMLALDLLLLEKYCIPNRGISTCLNLFTDWWNHCKTIQSLCSWTGLQGWIMINYYYNHYNYILSFSIFQAVSKTFVSKFHNAAKRCAKRFIIHRWITEKSRVQKNWVILCPKHCTTGLRVDFKHSILQVSQTFSLKCLRQSWTNT